MAYFYKQQGESGRANNPHSGHMEKWYYRWSRETAEELKKQKTSKTDGSRRKRDGR